jgi:hypothetical protein
VELERELLRVELARDVAGLLGVGDGRLERHQPLAHEPRDLVAHRPRAAVELDRGGHQKAAPAEHLALHVGEPGVRQRQDLLHAAARVGGAQDLLHEHLAGGPHGLHLEVELRAEVGEQAALADAERLGEATDGETL